MTALYVAGTLAVAITQCPRGASSACKVCVHGYRSRKAGPGFRLSVLHCKTHGCAFTAYPLGWFPYARRPLPETVEELLQVMMGDVESTLFGALQRMQREPWSTMGSSRRTHRRQFGRAADFVGLNAAEEDVAAVLTALGVDIMGLTELRQRYSRSTNWHERTKLIAALLKSVRIASGEPESLLLQRLQHVGYVTGNVGRAWWVDADSGGLFSVFPERECRAKRPL